MHMREKQKTLLNYIRLVGRYAFVIAKLIFGHSHASRPKTSQKKDKLVKNKGYSLAVTKGLRVTSSNFHT